MAATFVRCYAARDAHSTVRIEPGTGNHRHRPENVTAIGCIVDDAGKTLNAKGSELEPGKNPTRIPEKLQQKSGENPLWSRGARSGAGGVPRQTG
jgi:hypothetical protein